MRAPAAPAADAADNAKQAAMHTATARGTAPPAVRAAAPTARPLSLAHFLLLSTHTNSL